MGLITEQSPVSGLAAIQCVPCHGNILHLVTEEEAKALCQQVGWERVEVNNFQAIRKQYKVRNFLAALELFRRIGEVALEEGHHPDLHVQGYNSVSVELYTHASGGLTQNDFIVAAKLNQLSISDFLRKPKPRVL